jgi:hypothetical protein
VSWSSAVVGVAREELGTRVPPTHPPRGAAEPVAGGRGVRPSAPSAAGPSGPGGAETLLSVGPPPLLRDGRAHAVQPVQGPQDDRCEPATDRLELSQGEKLCCTVLRTSVHLSVHLEYCKLLERCCCITVDPETHTSENGICLTQQMCCIVYDLVSQRSSNKRLPVVVL